MIKMKDQVISPRSLQASNSHDSQQLVQLPVQCNSSFYSYSSHNNAQQITDQIHCNLISILLLFLFISIGTFTIIFGIKYIIVATTTYGNLHNCLDSDIFFNGWAFKHHCLLCKPQHHLDHSLHCQPV